MRPTLLLPLLLSSSLLAQTPPPPAPSTPPTPAAPTSPEGPDIPSIKPNPFLVAHEQFLKVARETQPELLFLGDSITAGWNSQKEIWDKYFAAWKPANFGISGDRTQHVLWRISNGELDGFTPKAIVLMIGTNNSGSDSAEAIARGVSKIVKTIREKSPKSKVLLLGIFPRSEKPDATREKLKAVNATLAPLDDRKHIFYLDIGEKFLQPDGSLSKEIMPDFLHLSQKGYQIWAEAITPTLQELLK
ncbi:MAG: hypothetical protein RLZZ142_110 [Verrucomicrobiota bacterium]|jgi:lysophospholipase L1-like esterase